MKTGFQLVIIIAVSMGLAGICYLIKGPPMRSQQCDPTIRRADEICLGEITNPIGILWVDARARAAWQKNGIPESILWNLDPAEDMQAFEANNAEKIATAQKVVVYCGDENCGVSRQVAERIRKLDLGPQILILKGGWRALKEAGRVGN